MAHIVCLLNVEADSASFTWSEGPASFEPYTLDGQGFVMFTQLTEQLRGNLRDLVTDYLYSQQENDDAISEEVRAASLATARTGYDLYKQVFSPAADQRDKAKRVRRWFEALRDERQIETLEIVVDGVLAIPWNVLYDEKPNKQAFLTGEWAGPHWKSFWGIRYNLSGGKKSILAIANPGSDSRMCCW